jgi:hypothetical protein
MAWIKVEQSLHEKTEVFAMARELHMSRPATIGHLIIFWSWADKNTADGTLVASREIIDTLTTEGFANALINVGWLDFTDDGEIAHIPNYDRHNGSSAKSRAMTADRVRKHRNKKSVSSRNATSVSREEKIREDKEKKGW